jgi:3-deoxy-D-manno-octulosonic-acid transferase
LKFLRYSKAKGQDPASYDILIIDNIGMLSSLYQYGHIAYIGGAFRGGLHNILEAATFGLPVIFGKHRNNARYQEAVDLVEKGGAFQIRDLNDLNLTMEHLLSDPEEFQEASKTCTSYVVSNSGATDKIMNYIKSVLDK